MAELFDGMNNRVRLLIGADNDILTDEILNSFDFSGISKKKIDDIVKIENATAEQQEIINACYVYQTALNAISIVYNDIIKSEQTTHSKVEYNTGKKLELIETISDRLNNCLLMLDIGTNTYSATVFTVSNEDSGYEGDVYHI